ncbi:MAG: hypothetical protein AB7I36_08190 [Rhodospirillaceae bacterium]
MFSGNWKRDVLIGLASTALTCAVLAIAGFFVLGPFGAGTTGAWAGVILGLIFSAAMWWMTWRMDNNE